MARKLKNTSAPQAHDIEAQDTPSGGHEPARTRARPATAQARAPQHDPDRRWPFRLIFSRNYELGEVEGVGAVLLPDFERILDKPGCNNVKQRKKGAPDCRLRDGKMVEQGRKEIPSAEYLDEMVSVDEDGERVTYNYLETERVIEFPTGRVQVVHDAARWNSWRADLYRRRIVTPPYDYEVEDIRHRLESTLERASSHNLDSDSDKSRWSKKRAEIERRLAVLDEAVANARALYGGQGREEVA